MDFQDSPEEAAYRAKAVKFLSENAAPKKAGQPEIAKRVSADELLRIAKDWQKLKADAGFACINWPKEWGGPGGTPMQHVIFAQEEDKFDVPYGIYQVGLGMCVPTIIKLGDDEMRDRFVGPALRGETVWCQLFSEPGAGSDLAAVRTRAVLDGDNWILNGQKVWTTNAHIADYGLLLARTDPSLPKHKGLTMFWVDMKAPGIDVRPIEQMSGKSSFNEVFFTDVAVADTQRVSEVNDGWKAALVTLMNERLSIGGSKGADWQEMLELAQLVNGSNNEKLLHDQGFRQRLADWYIQSEGARLTRFRAMTALSRGETPGPENSIGKLVTASLLQDLCAYAVEMQGLSGLMLNQDEAMMGAQFQQGMMKAPGSRIAGGTDEILRNTIAERVLGLPPEPRVDKDMPFNEVPTGR